MKIYAGQKTEHGTMVTIAEEAHQQPLPHFPFHSPSGFAWGYGGSGPADLAFAILIDHLDEHPPREGWKSRRFNEWAGDSLAYKLHQAFKWEFVATWGDAWTIDSQAIDAWVTNARQQLGE